MKSDTQNTNRHSYPPLFIFGPARSGTSLLSRIINNHPSIGVPFESHLYDQFHPWLKYYGDLNKKKNKERLIRDILQTDVMNGWAPKPDYDDIMQRLQHNIAFRDIVEAVMQAWLNKCNKQRWGEKTPWHMYYWREILNDFPDAKFIFIIRDGRDTALSWKNARFGPKHIYFLANRWKEFLDEYSQFRKTANRNNLIEIRYEDLLENPESTSRLICDHIGVEYSDDMLNFYKNAEAYPTDKNNNKNLSKPLMKSNREKWKSGLSENEVRVFEAVAGKELSAFGYTRATTNPSISNLEITAFRIIHPFLRAFSIMKNTKGHKDFLIRVYIYIRLRIHAAGF